MARFPDSRRRIAGISLFTIVLVVAVLYVLRRIPPRSPEEGRMKAGENHEK